MVEIKGLEKFAPKDFSGHIASTVFVGGCNFRCPFCHNADLVLNPHVLPTFPLDYFISFLDSRINWLEGVCVSGGEPLFHDDIEVLLRLIKGKNLLIKIDTNGSFPVELEELIRKGLVDQIAMDVKAPLEKYQEVAGSNVNVEDIQKSIGIIKRSGLEYVFRTTAVPGLISAVDIEDISKMLGRAKVFQIQQFMPTNTLDADYERRKPFRPEQLSTFAEMAKPYFSEVRVEGI